LIELQEKHESLGIAQPRMEDADDGDSQSSLISATRKFR